MVRWTCWFSRSPRPAPRPGRGTFALRVEGLEERAVPAASPALAVLARLDTAGAAGGRTGPLATVGFDLALLSREAQAAGGAAFTPSNSLLQVAGGRVAVEAVPASDPAALRAELAAVGFVPSAAPAALVSGWLPITSIPAAAGLPALASLHPSYRLVTSVGAVTSQGDAAVHANAVRSLLGLDGTGITVGVISDSFNVLGGAAADVTTGDLPADIGLPLGDGSAGRDEGRAMLQVVHDVAPGARLLFAPAGTSQADLAAAIRALASTQPDGRPGADVIVDDVTFPAEPMFQDGIVAQAVDQAARSGVVYFSAAGNLGRQSYQSAYRPGDDLGTAGTGVVTNDLHFVAHDFDPGPGVDYYQTVTLPAGRTTFSFQWADSYRSAGGPGARTDMDLAVFDAAGTFLSDVGGYAQNTGGDPTEVFEVDAGPAGGTFRLALGKVSGPDPAVVKYVAFADGVRIDTYATDSSTVFGHANAAGAAAVGAARVGTAAAEPFTGRGGTPILIDAAGDPQPAETRPQPRFVAPDGVSTTFFGAHDGNGVPNFVGTSAAAPHAAGVAALMLQANRALRPAQVIDTLATTALDIGDPGFDVDTGAGLIQALPAVLAVGDHFDVTLDGTTENDTFLVTRDASGANVLFYEDGGVVLSVPLLKLGRVTVRGGAGTDALTVDYRYGAPLTSAGLSFAGGESTGDADRLVLTGYAAVSVVVTHDGPETGTVQVDGTGLVSFAEIEPLILDGTTADLLVNLPATPNPDVAVGDDGGAADPDGPAGRAGFSAVSGSTFEYTRFRNPTRGLAVHLGDGGDTVALRGMDAAFAPAGPEGVAVVGGPGADAVTAFGGAGADALGYTPAAADGGVLTLAGGGAATRFTLSGVESLAADGQAQADAVTATAPRLGVAFGLVGGSGVFAPASAAGAAWLSLAYRNFERAAAVGTVVGVAGTSGADVLAVAADGTVTLGDPADGRAVHVSASELDLSGFAGADRFTVAADHPFTTVKVDGTGPGAPNALTVVGGGGAVTVATAINLTGTVTQSGFGPVAYLGIGTLAVNAAAGWVTLAVGQAEQTTDLTLTGPATATAHVPNGQQVLLTAGGVNVLAPTTSIADRLRVAAGVSGPHSVSIAGGAVRFAGLLPVAVGAGVDAVEADGGADDDTFTVTPGGVAVAVDGGPQATADRLVVLGAVPGHAAPGSGVVGTSPAVAYTNIELFTLGSQPDAAADAATTPAGGAVTVPVLANDTGLGDGPFTVAVVSAPAFGTAAVVGTAVVYTPNAGYDSAAGGPDHFTYRVTDANGDSSVGTVAVTVTPVNTRPQAFAQSAVLPAGGSMLVTLAADDGDPRVAQRLTYTITTAPAHGALSGFDPATGRITYTPAAGYDGPDSFTFVATDDDGVGTPALTSAPATVFLQMNRVNHPPVALADSATVAQGGTLASPDGGVRANDSDPDGDPLTVSLVSGPAHGTLTLDRRGTYAYTPDPAFAGTDGFVYAVADGRGGAATAAVTLTVTPTPRRLIATGAGEGGGPHVKVFDAATGAELFSFFAYDPAFRGGVKVAVGDVNGDGVPDIVTTPGPGGGPHVKVFSGVDMSLLASFYAYDPAFRSGANVAVGDLDGDGVAEIVTGAAPGGGSHVRSFDVRGGQGVQLAGPLGSFYAFGADFAGGVNVAVGDYDGAAGDEIIAGAASEFPEVRVFRHDGAILADFLAFDVARVGVTVAAGDVDGDGLADIIVGPGDGGGPVVRVFRGGTGDLLSSAAAFDPDLRGGISVAATRGADGRTAVVAAPTGQARSVVVLDPTRDTVLDSFEAYAADFPGGVYVGAG